MSTSSSGTEVSRFDIRQRKAVMNKYASLFRPGSIGNLRLENRLVMAAMGTLLATKDGSVTERMIDYYRPRAQGHVALVITQPASVNIEAAMSHTLALHDDRFVPGLSRLVGMVHELGTKIAVQLMHYGLLAVAGPKSLHEGMAIVVPSVTSWMSRDESYKEASAKDIDGYVEDFGQAARRAKEAGADAIELHACHGCLVSTFLSPVTNRRTDNYGGSIVNRSRLAVRIVRAIKELLGGEFPISVRINACDDVEGGISLDDVLAVAAILESAGADAISISAGLEYWSPMNIPGYAYPEGPAACLAQKVKRILSVPVIVAGKIGPELAEEVVREGKADFVAFGRPLLACPRLPAKLAGLDTADSPQCIYCNNCSKRVGDRLSSCTVNPFLYREARQHVMPTILPKKVLVVGGGIAGMQASILLAQKGHHVSLHEKSAELGGQWRLVSAMPGKEGYAAFADYLTRSLKRCGVEVRAGVEVDKQRVLEMRPDVVVVATGATPRGLEVPGAMASHVVQANDVVCGKAHVGKKVVVVGGRALGMEMAVWMAAEGREASLVTRSGLGGKGGPDEVMTHLSLLRRLVELRVPLYPDAAVLEISERSVVIGKKDDILAIPADTVILAVGAHPDDRLARELEGIIPEVYRIGDCVEARDGASATYEAMQLAVKV